jgi:hypothetical protein
MKTMARLSRTAWAGDPGDQPVRRHWPCICAVVLSMSLGAYTFVMGAGYSIAKHHSERSCSPLWDSRRLSDISHERDVAVTPKRNPAAARV